MKRSLLILLIVLLIGVGFWWAFRKSLPQWLGGTKTPSASTNATAPATVEQEVRQRAQQATEIQQLKLARDSRRMNDVLTLQTMLESYKIDHDDAYPQSLQELAPTYIAAAPTDPATGAQYQYSRTAGTVSYSLLYTLELGVNGVSAGPHTAMPGNIASP